jgi:hypothetical protein
MLSLTAWICWLPSSRLIVVVRGVKEPALMLLEPPVSDGVKGRLAPGQGLPPGPEVILKLELVL